MCVDLQPKILPKHNQWYARCSCLKRIGSPQPKSTCALSVSTLCSTQQEDHLVQQSDCLVGLVFLLVIGVHGAYAWTANDAWNTLR